MSNNFYDILGISKTASKEEIKKAYRKKAMQYHPDKNSGDKTSESKFKEVNEAYSILSDDKKKKQYDTFGSSGGAGNPFGGQQSYSSSGFGGFEDIFGGGSYTNGSTINLEDLFGSMGGSRQKRSTQRESRYETEEESLDFEKTYEVPIFDLILGCKIEVKSVYGKTAKLTIPFGTKPGSKFRVKDFGKTSGLNKGNLIVKVEAKMPKQISDLDKKMLETIRENIGY